MDSQQIALAGVARLQQMKAFAELESACEEPTGRLKAGGSAGDGAGFEWCCSSASVRSQGHTHTHEQGESSTRYHTHGKIESSTRAHTHGERQKYTAYSSDLTNE